jgi:fido (protein-threonine AMPylation protein)
VNLSQDLPIFSDSVFRGSNPFASLERAKGMNLAGCFERFDTLLDHGEGSGPAGPAREALDGARVAVLLEVHRRLFPGRPGAGRLRSASVTGVFAGQDCPEPAFIGASLASFEGWLSAASFGELHPIEQAALGITRLADLWPFDFGNRTAAVTFSNQFLIRAGFPPFFVLPDQISEFDDILAAAIRMDTAPLVRAIFRCLERELDLAGE